MKNKINNSIKNNYYSKILKIKNYIKTFFYLVYKVSAHLRKYNKNQNLPLINTFEFENIKSDKVCIFAHFDSQNLVDDYVMFYLDQIYENNISIIFVSASENFKQEEIEKLKKICSVVIIRKNLGYDFGSWKAGINYLNSKNFKPRIILLANDSVYGPINNHKELFKKITNFESCDVWGATDSFQIDYHLQSYFLSFHKRVIESPTWKKFWDNYEIHTNKKFIIRKYEIGLSQLLIKNGFKLKSYYESEKIIISAIRDGHEYKRLLVKHGNNVNVTHILWDVLVKKQFPFIKIELIRDNPVNVKTLKNFDLILSTYSNYDKNLIYNHLNRQSIENKSIYCIE